MRFEAGSERWPHQSLSASQGAVAGRHCAIRQRLSRGDIAIHQAAPLAMMWNTNPSTVIPTATAAIGNAGSTRCTKRNRRTFEKSTNAFYRRNDPLVVRA